MIRCGMSELVINPPLGSFVPGHFADRRLSEIKDDLYVKAAAIESDGIKLLFVVVDALFVLAKEVQAIRERIHKFEGIPPENIMVSATHTHTGPPIWPDSDDAYLAFLVDRAADAAILACRRCKPARIGFGAGNETEISFNRRFWMKDGTVRTNPGFDNPDLLTAEGPVDSEVTVIRIDDEQGQPLGVITNFACHPDTIGGTEASADYPGALSRELKKHLGTQVVSLFIQGASGNINHYDYTKPRNVQKDHYIKMGQILALEVIRVRDKIEVLETSEAFSLEVAYCDFQLTYRQATKSEAEIAHQVLNSPSSKEVEKVLADRLLQTMVNPVLTASTEIQAFRIGELTIVGLPGEIFAEFGLQIKREAPFQRVLVNTICNGTNTGYVCTREAITNGGYEPRLRNFSRNPAETGELFVEKAMELLHQLHR